MTFGSPCRSKGMRKGLKLEKGRGGKRTTNGNRTQNRVQYLWSRMPPGSTPLTPFGLFFVLCGKYRLKNVEILLFTLSIAIPFSYFTSLGAFLKTQFLLPRSLSKFLVMFCKLDCRNLWMGPTVGLHILKHSSINLRLNFRKVRKLL